VDVSLYKSAGTLQEAQSEKQAFQNENQNPCWCQSFARLCWWRVT